VVDDQYHLEELTEVGRDQPSETKGRTRAAGLEYAVEPQCLDGLGESGGAIHLATRDDPEVLRVVVEQGLRRRVLHWKAPGTPSQA
jgi:hypothetical protein